MGNVTIYPRGTADITVPAGQSIAISNFGGGIAQIYYLITAANAPPAFQFQQTLENSSVTLGAFSAETIVRIEANNSKVIYDVGASPDTGIGDADTLNGLPSDTTDTVDTIAARNSSGDIQANAFESTVATGTAPMVVSSTTVVTNFNADMVDGIQGSNLAKLNGTQAFSGVNTFSSTTDSKIILSGSENPAISLRNTAGSNLGYLIYRQSSSSVEVGNSVDGSRVRVKDAIDFTQDGVTYYSLYHAGNDSTLAKINATSGALQLPTLASDPASGASNGQMYYNTTSHVIRAYINGSWVDNT